MSQEGFLQVVSKFGISLGNRVFFEPDASLRETFIKVMHEGDKIGSLLFLLRPLRHD